MPWRSVEGMLLPSVNGTGLLKCKDELIDKMLSERRLFNALTDHDAKVDDLARRLNVRNKRLIIDVARALEAKGLAKVKKSFLSGWKVKRTVQEYAAGKGRITAILNIKGGVGKTTTAINLGACLAQKGDKTLIVDLDPQGSATHTLSPQGKPTVYELLSGETAASAVVKKTNQANLDIIPSDLNLAAAEIELTGAEGAVALKEALEGLRAEYKHIIIDCPPSFSALTVNAIVAADAIVTPVECDQYAMDSLEKLTAAIEAVKAVNPSAHLGGILMTRFNPKNDLNYGIEKDIRSKYPDHVFRTIIPEDSMIPETAKKGMTLPQCGRESEGLKAYAELAAEVTANG